MSLCYVYNVNVIPHPRENYIVTLPKIHVCLGPLWQTEIFLPLEKIMDPRMMLVGIYRRYEYIGDYRYTHRCTRVTCSCYLHVFSMKSFISCQSSKNCPRPTLLAEKTVSCVWSSSMIRLDYIPCADPGFLFREKEELMEEGYPSLPGGGRSEVYFTN